MTVRRLLAAALVALATGAAALAGLAVAPATATSGYCTGSGVNVLVDFTGQGGGITRACAPQGAGGSAWNAFEQAGVSLTAVQRYPGAVCRVNGRPADAGCATMPPADAYWGFFTSRGRGWTYASVGPDSYRVANGDTIAFAWQGSSSKRVPAAAPATPHRAQTSSQPSSQAPSPAPSRAAHPATTHTSAPPRHPMSAPSHPAGTATPKASAASSGPSRSPSQASTRTGAGTQSGHRARPRRVTAPSASAATTPTAGSADPSVAADPSAASSTPATPTTQTADTTGGVPWWAPVLVLVVLAGAGGAFAWRRRTGLR